MTIWTRTKAPAGPQRAGGHRHPAGGCWWSGEREVTGALVDLLIATVHRVGARAERKVTEELINAFKRVSGKENLLFTIADASLAAPDGTVREVAFPAVRGGEQTLRELVHELDRRRRATTIQATRKSRARHVVLFGEDSQECGSVRADLGGV